MDEQINQKFSDYLSLNNILCNVEAADATVVLSKLLEALKLHYPKLDIEHAGAEVRAREAIFPTVVSPGLAVPHARVAGLKTPLVAVACIPDGADCKDCEEKIKISVLVLTPLDEPNLHLQILSALAGAFSDPGKLEQLSKSATPKDFYNALLCGDCGQGEKNMPAYLTAIDVMSMPAATLLETDTLGHAIRTFATTGSEELPVLDSTGDLRGILSLSDILHHSLPKHLLWMEDLTPIYQFQPFAELLKTAEETKVADVMREEFIAVESDVPAVQLAKLFLVNKVSQLLITKESKYIGIVELKSFCARLFWE